MIQKVVLQDREVRHADVNQRHEGVASSPAVLCDHDFPPPCVALVEVAPLNLADGSVDREGGSRARNFPANKTSAWREVNTGKECLTCRIEDNIRVCELLGHSFERLDQLEIVCQSWN